MMMMMIDIDVFTSKIYHLHFQVDHIVSHLISRIQGKLELFGND